MAQATGLYAIIAYTRAGEGYGYTFAHSTVGVCHRARFGALPQKGKNEKRLDQGGFENCRRGTDYLV